jgi:hypothetical protein
MMMLVLCGTGLFGIVLSTGTYFARKSDPGLARFLEQAVRLAKFAVPVCLLLLFLCASSDFASPVKDILGKMVENIRALR